MEHSDRAGEHDEGQFHHAIRRLLSFRADELPADEKLEIALDQLDLAHQEIDRLIRLHGEIISAPANQSVVRDGSTNDSRSGTNPLSSNLAGMKPIDSAVAAEEYDVGYVWALALYGRLRTNVGYLKRYRTVQSKRGAITKALKLTYEIAAVDRTVSSGSVQLLEGRVREISGWLPRVPGPTEKIENPVAGRVLHLVKESRPYLSNGFTSRSHKNFAAELDSGLQPIVVTEPGFPRAHIRGNPPKTETIDGIQHVRLDLGAIDYSAIPVDSFLQAFADLAYVEVKKYRPSIIHASSGRRGYDTALVGLALKRKTGLPFVYEVRSFFEANWTGDISRESTGEIFDRRMLVEEMCMHGADKVLTLGEAMRDEIISRGIHPEKVEIIPNAVDPAVFEPRPRSTQLDEQFGISNFPTIGYVSNMDHYRESQETLIEAVAILRDRGVDLRCVLVGDGPRSPILKKLAADLGVTDRIIFTGSVDHDLIPDYYSMIDIFVVPRIGERAATFVTPLKPFEAMALGLPLIVSDLPALREIVSADRGKVFTPGEALSLAKVVEETLLDPMGTAEMAKRGREWVLADRSWAANGERYVDVFSRTIREMIQ